METATETPLIIRTYANSKNFTAEVAVNAEIFYHCSVSSALPAVKKSFLA